MIPVNNKVLKIYLFSVIICGSVYWPIKIKDLETTHFYMTIWMISIMAFAAIANVVMGLDWKKTIVSCGLTLPTVTFIKIVIDFFIDPTSHSLWPFEIIIVFITGFLQANLGFIIGLVIRKFNKKVDEE